MKILNTLANVALVFSVLAITFLLFIVFTDSGFAGKIPNSIEDYVLFGPIVLLTVSLVGKIILGIASRGKSAQQYNTGVKNGNTLLSVGLVVLSIAIHSIYFFFIGMSCGFGAGASVCFFGFGSIFIGIILSVWTGIRLSKISNVEDPKGRVVLYLLANATAPILMAITVPSYFNL